MSIATLSEPEIRSFTASDGYCFRYRHWRVADGSAKGHVVAVHGIQSHSGWYEYSSRKICEAGYEVSFLDRRGSGLNDEHRGHAPHYERLVNDVVQFLTEVRLQRDRESPVNPVILLSVSWGGKLAAATCAIRPELVDALALLYPGICARVRPGWWQKIKLRFAEAMGVRHRQAPIPLDDPALFTAETKWQRYIREDPMALHRVSVPFLIASRELDRKTLSTPKSIECPVLLMLAGRDEITDNRATRRYFNRLASKRKQFIEYEQARHTLEFEPNRERIVDDLIDWLGQV